MSESGLHSDSLPCVCIRIPEELFKNTAESPGWDRVIQKPLQVVGVGIQGGETVKRSPLGCRVPGVTMGWSVGGGDWKWKEGSQREEVSTHQRGSDLKVKEEDK